MQNKHLDESMNGWSNRWRKWEGSLIWLALLYNSQCWLGRSKQMRNRNPHCLLKNYDRCAAWMGRASEMEKREMETNQAPSLPGYDICWGGLYICCPPIQLYKLTLVSEKSLARNTRELSDSDSCDWQGSERTQQRGYNPSLRLTAELVMTIQ